MKIILAEDNTRSQIDWQPDTLTWSIDNNAVRTLKRSDTVDDQGISHFPNTPSRVQLRSVCKNPSIFLVILMSNIIVSGLLVSIPLPLEPSSGLEE